MQAEVVGFHAVVSVVMNGLLNSTVDVFLFRRPSSTSNLSGQSLSTPHASSTRPKSWGLRWAAGLGRKQIRRWGAGGVSWEGMPAGVR